MKRIGKATLVASAAALLLTFAAVRSLQAQAAVSRTVDVTVTDPYGRTVAGLEKDRFAITEGGIARVLRAFSEVRTQEPRPGVHYQLQFESATSDARVKVTLNPPPGLPQFTVTWK